LYGNELGKILFCKILLINHKIMEQQTNRVWLIVLIVIITVVIVGGGLLFWRQSLKSAGKKK